MQILKKILIVVGFVIVIVGALLIIGAPAYLHDVVEQNKTEIQDNLGNSADNEASTDSVAVIDDSEWKEYENDKYKFTIKYPPDWPITFLNDVVTIGTPEPNPVDNYTKCYMTFTFTGNRDSGAFVPTPHKFINFMINEVERTEKCGETLNKITESFALLSVNTDFPVTLKNTYTKTKVDLAAKGWTPVTPNNCMSRGDSMCEVSFKKGSQTKLVIIQSKNGEWIVVGYDN